jgi:hypothetical protein
VAEPPERVAPAHIYLLRLFGHAFSSRLVTQMYFPGDPLFELNPIFNSGQGRTTRRSRTSQRRLERVGGQRPDRGGVPDAEAEAAERKRGREDREARLNARLHENAPEPAREHRH